MTTRRLKMKLQTREEVGVLKTQLDKKKQKTSDGGPLARSLKLRLKIFGAKSRIARRREAASGGGACAS